MSKPGESRIEARSVGPALVTMEKVWPVAMQKDAGNLRIDVAKGMYLVNVCKKISFMNKSVWDGVGELCIEVLRCRFGSDTLSLGPKSAAQSRACSGALSQTQILSLSAIACAHSMNAEMETTRRSCH